MNGMKKHLIGGVGLCALLASGFVVWAGEHPVALFASARAAAGEDDQATSTTSTWVGVRLSPVPEALATHFGEGGLMIANVAKDSPADAAGLARYDIIRSADGRSITEMADLIEAINAAGTREMSLSVVHAGKEQTVRLSPAQRPADGAYSFKYSEPEAMDEVTRYFGHRLKQDESGNWVFEPLGRLRDIPDALADPAWRQWMGNTQHWRQDPLQFRLRVDPDMGMFFFDDKDGDGAASVSVTVDDGGIRTSIERHPDGTIEVRRTDADGKESVATYKNADELEQQDPEAYKAYRSHAGFRQRRTITITPELKELQRSQGEWRKELNEALERLQRDASNSIREAQRLQQKVEREVRSQRRPAQRQSDVRTSTSSTAASVAADGSVHIRIERDGKVEEYNFPSEEDFRDNEPQLYEQFKWLFDGGGRTQLYRLIARVT